MNTLFMCESASRCFVVEPFLEPRKHADAGTAGLLKCKLTTQDSPLQDAVCLPIYSNRNQQKVHLAAN